MSRTVSQWLKLLPCSTGVLGIESIQGQHLHGGPRLFSRIQKHSEMFPMIFYLECMIDMEVIA